MTTANQSKRSIIRNRRGLEARNLPEARETRVTKLCLVLVWNLIGQESGANFQDQSKSEVKQERTIYILLRLCVHDDSPPLHKILQRFPLFFFFFFFLQRFPFVFPVQLIRVNSTQFYMMKIET